MKNSLLFSLLFTGTLALGQQTTQFREMLQPELVQGSNTLINGFAGGLNTPQFIELDLNLDGTMDMVIFERQGNVLMPFIAEGSGANTHYKFAPEYKKNFPPVQHYLLTADFNCDGKLDIFTSTISVAVAVYENTSTDSLSFSWALGSDPYLYTDFLNGQTSNVHIPSIDIPVIQDIDGDGDIDILSFGTSGVDINFYENQSANHCGLDFLLTQNCWGGFREDQTSNAIQLDACITGAAPPFEDPEGTMHSGSTLLSLDMNNDGLQELVIGDVSFPTTVLAHNAGTPDSAYMNNQTILWAPDGTHVIDIPIFPACYYQDIDFDGIPDLVCSTNQAGFKNQNQVWRFKNNGTRTTPSFSFVDSTFMVNTMLDLGESANPTFADINGDGLPDLIVGSKGVWKAGGDYEAAIYYLKNTSTLGNISFEITSTSLVNLTGLSGAISLYPTLGDLDGDNDLDMIIGLEDGTLLYYINTGSYTIPQFTFSTANYQGIDVGFNAAPELYDVNNDGQLDLIIGEKDGNLNYYENNSGTFVLKSSKFGGVTMDKGLNYTGYSTPRFYEFNGKDQLMVGSRYYGIEQYDSARAIVGLPSYTQATLGTGTTSTSGFEETPFGALKRTGRNQLLYTAQELQSLGFSYGQIEDISFNVTVTNTSNSITNGITVRMKNTSTTSLNGFETDLDEVYDGTMPVAPGWNTITLESPFVWDGTSNLVIEICFQRNLPLLDNDVEATDVGFNANAYGDITGFNNNTSDGCVMPYKASSTLRPNTTMTIRPITPPAGQVLDGWLDMSADFADLDSDGFPEAAIGVQGGGIVIFKGEAKGISVRENNRWSKASIYPNPTDGLIRVDMEDLGDALYTITDLNGRIRAQGSLPSSGELDLSDWETGVYILQIQSGNDWSYAKILKQ